MKSYVIYVVVRGEWIKTARTSDKWEVIDLLDLLRNGFGKEAYVVEEVR